MAVRRILLPWDSQPQEAADADWENPLSKSLVLLANHENGIDATGIHARPTVGSAIAYGVGQRGKHRATVADHTNARIVYPHNASTDVGNSALTFASLLRYDGAGNYGSVLGRTNASQFTGLLVGAATNKFSYWVKATGQVFVDGGALTLISGGIYFVVMTYDSVNGLKGYINGLADASAAANGNATSNTSDFYIGAEPSTGGRTVTASHYLSAAWSRALSQSEIVSLSANPWQLFAPRTIWVPVSAGGGAGITATLATTLDALTSTATGTLPIVGTASPTLAALTSTATGTLAATGTLTSTLADVTLTAAATSSTTGVVNATLAALTSVAAGALPITGTASPTLAALTSSATGTLPIRDTAAITLDAVTTDGAGTSQAVTTGTLSTTLGDATLSSAGTVLLKGSASVTLGDCTIVATATMPLAGISGVATPTLGDLTSAATGTLAIAGVVGATLANCTLVSAGADPSTDTNSAWWTYTVPADNLTFSVAADDLTYTIGV